MIELKENDLVAFKSKERGNIDYSVIWMAAEYHYYTKGEKSFKHDFIDDDNKYEIIAVWRYNEETGNYLKIYDKDMPYINDPKFRNKPCQSVKLADVPYDKYISLQSENAELRNIIVELNKKIYENNQIH
jgi:hypothetical protein